ncbi:MAG TPA: UDP-N-acetylmuramate dehydrogenase [Patescibacteria group bacterium]|nr:UDP-N-acetylmuramate dehydrogenase [Patescibacteria group bacterium]
MDSLYQELKKYGQVKANEPLAKYTSYKIGGPADYLVVVEETEKLVAILRYLTTHGLDYLIIGGGSNILFSDEGYRGIVIINQCRHLEIKDNRMVVDSGCPLGWLTQQASQAGLSGLAWAVGIPGTIGGAIRGNAGIPQGEIRENVEQVEVYRDGEVLKLDNQGCRFGYRESIFKKNNDVILRAWLTLGVVDKQKDISLMLTFLKERQTKQPQGSQSAGSVFKNIDCRSLSSEIKEKIPPEVCHSGWLAAGWLIEQVGLKGQMCGRAQISPKHSNFILNLDRAKSQDVQQLIALCREKVYNKFGIELEEEIKIIK